MFFFIFWEEPFNLGTLHF